MAADFEGDAVWDADDATRKLDKKLFGKLSTKKVIFHKKLHKEKTKSSKVEKKLSKHIKKDKKSPQKSPESPQRKKKKSNGAKSDTDVETKLKDSMKKLKDLKERRLKEGTLTKQQKKRLKKRLRFTQKKLSGEIRTLPKTPNRLRKEKNENKESEKSKHKGKKRKSESDESLEESPKKKSKVHDKEIMKDPKEKHSDKKNVKKVNKSRSSTSKETPKKKKTAIDPTSAGNQSPHSYEKRTKNKYIHLVGINKHDHEAKSTATPRSPFNMKRLKNIMNSPKVTAMLNGKTKDEEVNCVEQVSKKKVKNKGLMSEKSETEDHVPTTSKGKLPTTSKGKLQEKLNSARFRYINEQLYTRTGEEALELFKDDTDAFKVYHEGFSSQVSKWPSNPLDQVKKYIISRPKSLVVADFGCGDATLARKLKNKVHSFDLVALHKCVTVCNMSDVPLENSSIDIAVFCLSLMGTEVSEFILEAHRVLKPGGTLLIAEVVSRIEKLGSLIRKLQKIGFRLTDKDTNNKMFVWMELEKTGEPIPGHVPLINLLPCIYKKR